MNDFVGSFGIQGEIEVPDGVDFDTFCNKFLDAMKILGWRFAGFFEGPEEEEKYDTQTALRENQGNQA